MSAPQHVRFYASYIGNSLVLFSSPPAHIYIYIYRNIHSRATCAYIYCSTTVLHYIGGDDRQSVFVVLTLYI